MLQMHIILNDFPKGHFMLHFFFLKGYFTKFTLFGFFIVKIFASFFFLDLVILHYFVVPVIGNQFCIYFQVGVVQDESFTVDEPPVSVVVSDEICYEFFEIDIQVHFEEGHYVFYVGDCFVYVSASVCFYYCAGALFFGGGQVFVFFTYVRFTKVPFFLSDYVGEIVFIFSPTCSAYKGFRTT